MFDSLGYILRSRIAGSHGNSIFNFEELPDCFPKWLYHFTFPPVGYEGSNFSTSLPVLVSLLVYSPPSRCEALSCGFVLI